MQVPVDENYIRSLHFKYAASQKVFAIVFPHCQIVWEIAEQLIRKNKLILDEDLVKAGCLIHDIGVYKLLGKDGICDDANYIKHGIEGYKILKEEGLPEELCRVAERHTGMGIRQREIIKNNLPLPPKDYIAETVEEKLVMYADKFHSKDPKFNSYESYRQYIKRYGEEKERIFEELVNVFGLPELELLSSKYGHPLI